MSRGPSAVSSDSAPKPIGPYSQAIESGGFLFLSGQIGIDYATGGLVSGGVTPQTEVVLRNLASVLEAAGASVADVVKVSIYLRDIRDFPAVNEVYGRFFSSWKPARTTLGGVQLPKDALVEIDAVARLP
ncbi:MAG TPA: hypothetical protein HA364_08075 [Thermoplasmata archaeon]|nr:hypothetical protein [Thermoplasmata archaeon]